MRLRICLIGIVAAGLHSIVQSQILACEPGYWGDKCKPCSHKGCKCTNTDNCPGCIDGYYSDHLLCKQCTEVCLKCTNATICKECKPGYSGNTCQIVCSSTNCICSSQGQCDRCVEGYHNTLNNCTDKCKPNCLTCLDEDTCIACKSGKYAKDCDLNCSRGCIGGVCTFMDGTCACAPNFIGDKCEYCAPGYYGALCETCPLGCFDHICNKLDGTCEANGSRTSGCKDGLWNARCTERCRDKCQFCNQTNGECLTCLTTNVYGCNCDFECSKHCLNQSCSMNGECNLGCATHFFGRKCDIPCPENCADRGLSSRCSNDNGTCMFGCRDGFIGATCAQVIAVTAEVGKDASGHTAAAIGGGVASVVIVLAIVLILMVIYIHKRRNKHDQTSDYETTQRSESGSTDIHLYSGLHGNNI
ncbi:multiple epidermal growth factor-like domains protein 10 [Dreissena polymorpha]|uniref:EGF-like domain-containing protein n=1 Tax=Dreissena polymorpha TaxID=45954 RepID=A0A9D4FLJ1_DREPO|nr:multiple epidermal growth factor-like domains protein 10 [Dreissena polymorpha]KAH3798986.1 hypothetical protein DPMN_152590 [Dreissena polymorpha]